MPKQRLTAISLLAALCLGICGCGERSLDSPEYGEIIHEVPAHLNKPYPLPELELPSTTAAPGPQSSDEKQPDGGAKDK